MRKRYNTAKTCVILAALVALGLSFIFPFVFMIGNSFKTDTAYNINPLSWPASLELGNYVTMVSQFRIVGYMANSLLVSTLCIVLSIATSVAASYAFAKFDFRGAKALYVGVVATMFVPAQVTLIPLYVLYSRLGLVDSPLSVVFAYAAGGLPSCVMLLTAYFRSIPNELLEAARMDGSGFLRTLSRVVIPMGKPAIALNVIFIFLGSWNDVFTPLILLTKREGQTVVVALAGLVGRYNGSPSFQMAGLVIACLPVLAMYLVFQRYLIEGMNVGAIK
jgi:ABC-type glycerol-3-phosphate transport system permease component